MIPHGAGLLPKNAPQGIISRGHTFGAPQEKRSRGALGDGSGITVPPDCPKTFWINTKTLLYSYNISRKTICAYYLNVNQIDFWVFGRPAPVGTGSQFLALIIRGEAPAPNPIERSSHLTEQAATELCR